MAREINRESLVWKEVFQIIEKILKSKGWKRSGLFREIEKHFGSLDKKIDEKTLGNHYCAYEESKGTVFPKRVEIADVSASELGDYLRRQHADVLNDEMKFDQFDFHYIYHYESSDGYIKPAIICLKKANDDFGDGVIYYLSKNKNGYAYNYTFILTRLKPSGGIQKNQKFAFYQAASEKHPDQMNTFTFNIAERPVEKRFLFFASCNVISNTKLVKIASVNFGVLRRFEKRFIMEGAQAGPDPWIANALIGKRISFGAMESSVFTEEEKFLADKNSDAPDTANIQYTCSNLLKASYLGAYLRSDVQSSTTRDRGGVAFVILQSFEDGNASIHFIRRLNNKIVPYHGAFHFPTDDSKTIRGDFKTMKPHVYRFSLFLEKLEDENKMTGVFSGLKRNLPFASPIAFYKIGEDHEKLSDLITAYNPRRVGKHDIEGFLKEAFKDDWAAWQKEIKEDLTQASKKFVENFDDCFLDGSAQS